LLKIVLEDEYEKSNYEETSHMAESGSISPDDLQKEEFILDNGNEDVKGDWILLITQKDVVYKKFIFSLKGAHTT